MRDTPQADPRQAEPSRRLPWLATIAVVLLLGVPAAWWWTHRTAPDTPAGAGGAAVGADPARKPGRPGQGGAPSVVAGRTQTRDFEVWADALGTVTPLANVTVRSRVDGELLRVAFRESARVEAGQLLAEIDPRTFQVQLDQALAQQARDQALLDNARVDLARYRDLAAHDAVPRQQFDTQQSLVNQYEAALRTDQAAVDSARLQLGFCRIVAPISGQVGLRLVDPGNMVHASDTGGLVTLAQMDPISVLFSLPQDLLPQLTKRLHGREAVRIEAYDRAGKMLLASGSLSSLDNQIDTGTGTIKLRGRFTNRDGRLYPNQFVNARVLLDVRRHAVVAPAAALLRGAQGPYVYVLGKDRTVSVRPITPGPVEHGDLLVEQGLADGEQVIIDGTDKLRDGLQVVVADATDTPRGGGRPGGHDGGKEGGPRRAPGAPSH